MIPPNYPARIRPSHVIEFGSNQVTDNSSKFIHIDNGVFYMASKHGSYLQASYRVKVTRSAPRVAQKEATENLQKV